MAAASLFVDVAVLVGLACDADDSEQTPATVPIKALR